MTLVAGRLASHIILNNRYHDPTLGRFISVDPTVATTREAYLYSHNNPITYADPSGLWGLSNIKKFVKDHKAAILQVATVIAIVAVVVVVSAASGGTLGVAAMSLANTAVTASGTLYGSLAIGAATGVAYYLGDTREPTALGVVTSAAMGAGFAGLDHYSTSGAPPRGSELDRLETRAAEFHKELGSDIAQDKRTTSAASTVEGPNVVSGGKRDLTPAQRAIAREGEILGKNGGLHAEQTNFEVMDKLGLTPREIVATRPFCPTCSADIVARGGTIQPGGKRATFF
jgi:hypothetical protein